MAGGPIKPDSTYPTSSFVFPRVHDGAGGGSEHDEGYGLTDATTLTADATWELRFEMGPVIPSGTPKLKIWSLANAVTGVIKVNPKHASVAAGEDPSSATLNAEGTSTITWSTGDADKYIETLIVLDADTPLANEVVAMDLVFENTGTTLAVESTHRVSIVWED